MNLFSYNFAGAIVFVKKKIKKVAFHYENGNGFGQSCFPGGLVVTPYIIIKLVLKSFQKKKKFLLGSFLRTSNVQFLLKWMSMLYQTFSANVNIVFQLNDIILIAKGSANIYLILYLLRSTKEYVIFISYVGVLWPQSRDFGDSCFLGFVVFSYSINTFFIYLSIRTFFDLFHKRCPFS